MGWTLIEHQALSSSVASVTLGSGGTIPQTYKTLKLVISARADAGSAGSYLIRPNGSTSNLSSRYLWGNGTGITSGNSGTLINVVGFGGSAYTASTFASTTIEFPNYTSTNTNKPASADSAAENNASGTFMGFTAGLWSNNSAITSLVILNDLGNFVQHSTFSLYGLA